MRNYIQSNNAQDKSWFVYDFYWYLDFHFWSALVLPNLQPKIRQGALFKVIYRSRGYFWNFRDLSGTEFPQKVPRSLNRDPLGYPGAEPQQSDFYTSIQFQSSVCLFLNTNPIPHTPYRNVRMSFNRSIKLNWILPVFWPTNLFLSCSCCCFSFIYLNIYLEMARSKNVNKYWVSPPR